MWCNSLTPKPTKPVLKCKGFREVRSDLCTWRCTLLLLLLRSIRGGSRGRVQGVCTPPPTRDDLWFSNTTGILQKKKTFWFIGVEVERETSAPPLKKILDPPLSMMIHLTLPTHDNVGTCRHIDHGNQVYVFRWRVTWLVFFTAIFRFITQRCCVTSLKTPAKETMTWLDPCPLGK